jgi:hypothetical protein
MTYVTLAQARLVAGDDVDRMVIDEYIKENYVLENIPFHQAAAPTGGSASNYTYSRLITQPTAAFRALNSPYDYTTSLVQDYTVATKPFGGKFGIDRTLAPMGGGAQVVLQMEQQIKGAKCLFNHTAINGSVADNALSFDGLDVALTGSSTENTAGVDLYAATQSKTDAFIFLDYLDALIGDVNGTEGLIIGGSRVSTRMVRSAIRQAGHMTASEDAAGRVAHFYNGFPIVDLGERPGSTDAVVATTDGLTDLYVVRLAKDAFHAVSPAGQPIVKTWLPKEDTGDEVLTGSVEMLAAVVLKATKGAAVGRNVRVAPEGS